MRSCAASWLLFLAAFGFFGFFAHGYVENTDAEITLHGARAWWLRGDPGLVGADESHLLSEGEPTWAAEHGIVVYITHPDLTIRSYGRTGTNGKHYVWFPIGHQLLLVPCVAIGDLLARWFPAPEAKFRAERGAVFGEFYWSRFLASFVSPLCAAWSFVLLLGLAVALGADRRSALIAVLAATVCTQFWPGSSETMSNAPGTAFLIAAVLALVRHERGANTRPTLILAGLATGAAVLVRYPTVLVLLPFVVWTAIVSIRRGRTRDLVWLGVGGTPALVFLLVANWLRFGDVAETGYTQNAGFGQFPIGYGLIAILLAPGKGVLWFSPPLWIALLELARRKTRSALAIVAGVALAAPTLLFATVLYWGAGQCWGIRYLTGPLVLVLVIVFAQTRPWLRRPRTFAAVCAVGAVFAIAGVITPYVGQQQLALQAGSVEYARPTAIVHDNVNFSPRYSPLHTHYKYAWLSLFGDLDSGRSSDTTEPLFGVVVPEPAAGQPNPLRLAATESGFRHWWCRALAHYWDGYPGWLAALLWIALSAVATHAGLRRWLAPDAR